MTEPTHRVVGGAVHRPDETLQPGEECTPTDAELSAFPDRFEPLPAAGDGDDTPSGGVTVEAAEAFLAEQGVDVDDYRELQSLAGGVESVAGNLPRDELVVGLAEALGV